MASSFDAIPLPRRGESFLLRTTSGGRDRVILVDVGWHAQKVELGNALDAYLTGHMPEIDTIDRLILTHEDSDHCGGASQFISNWIRSGRSISQVWLPAIWAPAGAGQKRSGWIRSRIVKGAFQAAPEIVEKARRLARDLGDTSARDDRVTTGMFEDDLLMAAVRDAANESGALSELFTPFEDAEPASPLEAAVTVEDGDWPEDDWEAAEYLFQDEAEALDRASDALEMAVSLDAWGEILADTPRSQSMVTMALGFADNALETHPRIADVIAACALFHLPVRWFDFDQFEKRGKAMGGDPEFLTPVNAVEVRLRSRIVSPKALFYALALSRANRECLSYLRHEEGAEPAVLFTGDSRLNTRGKPFPRPAAGLPGARNLLVTAMHHASDHNEPGYAVLRTWLGGKYPPLLVRNGGHGVRRPASSFKRVRDRQCVRCIGSALPERAVHLETFGGRWRMPSHPRRCVCK